MSREFINGHITISRPMGSDNNFVRIAIKDKNSRAEFCEIRISLEDFSKVLLGQGHIPMQFTTKGLDVVGLFKEVIPLEFPLPPDSDYLNRKDLAKELAERNCYEGFKPDLYFGSQSSFKTTEHGIIAKTTQYRYVKKLENKNE